MKLIRSLHTTARLKADFSHVVIGGGIIGTSIASELQKDSHNVLLLEKNSHLGMETTSRNSEVIHGGIYYPKDSLKSKLCIQGKEMIYKAVEDGLFSSVQVPIKKCGKLIVAQDEEEIEYLRKIHNFTNNEVGVPTDFYNESQLKSEYPHLKGKLALNSPTTGIISVHDYLLYHQTQFENNDGILSTNTEVTDINFNQGIPNYSISCRDIEGNDFEITSDCVINSGGLFAPKISNLLLPASRHYTGYFAKGTYFSYQPIKSLGKFTDKLIYPCPNPNAASLGTHLTFDMGGQIKFGPDLEWLKVNDPELIDYSPSDSNLQLAYEAVKRYLPAIQKEELSPSYTGVRPKVLSKEKSKNQFADFIIKHEPDYPGFINLLGMESPGVTAAWAIANHVKSLL